METPGLFDKPTGEQLRDKALDLLAEHRSELILELQRCAMRIALDRADFTADDVREAMPIPIGTNPVVLGSAIGSLSRGGYLKQIGYRKSTRAVAHRRPVAIWYAQDKEACQHWLDNHKPGAT